MEQLTTEERITVQEKALKDVHCELALLRQHVDGRFTGMDAQFASMREYVDGAIAKAQLEMQLYVKDEIGKAVALLSARIDAVESRADRNFRWMMGLQVTILLSLAAMAARGLLV